MMSPKRDCPASGLGDTPTTAGKNCGLFRLEQVTDGAELTEQLARGRQLLGAGADQKL